MLETIASHAGDISCIVAVLMMIVKPIREKLFGDAKVKEGYKCLLRSEIVRIYYRHLEHKQLHQYEYENMCYCYKAYKELGGNSFVDHIFAEMEDWKIVQ